MSAQIVIGLFYTTGSAEDVRNRLKSQGVPDADIAVRQVRNNLAPATMAGELRVFAGDPFFGNVVLKKFGDRLGDGETVVIVAAQSDDEVSVALVTMRQYTPVAVELLAPEEVEPFLHR